ncbi:MAG: 16S rRNA (cytosine(1402)-N(4))-methyltransferase RsmH [Pseudomonadota bacterium]
MMAAPHIPVLLDEVIAAAYPVTGIWLDGTLGAGGYTRGLLDAGAAHVLGVDQDPEAARQAEVWSAPYNGRFTMCPGRFGMLDEIAQASGRVPLDGVVLDIGVSSMQLDQGGRGFSFAKEGPLDMRMAQSGPTAAELVNSLPEAAIADILFQYGEERASRRIAKAIVEARQASPIETTLQLSEIIEALLPKARPGQPHPATRSFQALRIAVNGELRELARGLLAAERALGGGGMLIVVTFHSLEDRIVKRFLASRAGRSSGGSRHAPAAEKVAPSFELVTRKAVSASPDELAVNPRSRSAKLRAARRLPGPPADLDLSALGLPRLDMDALTE